MGTIKQYRPGYFTGYENEIKEFNSLEELLELDFVVNFRKTPNISIDPKFHQYSISKNSSGSSEFPYVLMAEFRNGTEWWVVGYISETEIIKELPVWNPKEKQS